MLYNGYFGAGHNVNHATLKEYGLFDKHPYLIELSKDNILEILRLGGKDVQDIIINKSGAWAALSTSPYATTPSSGRISSPGSGAGHPNHGGRVGSGAFSVVGRWGYFWGIQHGCQGPKHRPQVWGRVIPSSTPLGVGVKASDPKPRSLVDRYGRVIGVGSGFEVG